MTQTGLDKVSSFLYLFKSMNSGHRLCSFLLKQVALKDWPAQLDQGKLRS